MGAQAVEGAAGGRATRRTFGASRDASGWARWAGAIILGAVVLLLLPWVQPAPVDTRTAADLAGRRDMIGFYKPETDALGNSFVWTNRDASAAFDFASRKPLTVLLELRSAAITGGPDAPVVVFANEREVATVRPAPQDANFQTFRVRVPGSDTPLLRVDTRTETFGPRPNDGRTLGVMVRSVSVDRTEAWSTITRRAWLYWLVPLCALAVFAAATLSRVAPGSGTASRLAGYGAVVAAAGGAATMALATTLLLSIGEIDRGAYYLWLLGGAYLAALCAAIAVALPFGAADAPSLWRRFVSSAFVARHAPRLRLAAGVALLAGVLLLAAGLFTYYGTGDVDRKLKWMNNVRAYGLAGAYAGIPDQYPPLTLTILAATDRVGDALRLDDFAAFKWSLLLFTALTAAVFLLWTRDMPLTAAMTTALLPNAMALGYTDIYLAPPLIGLLWALRGRRWVVFSLCLALACLIKWQAAILAPPLLLAALRMAGEPLLPAPSPTGRGGREEGFRREGFPRHLAALLLPGAALTLATLLIFGWPVVASLVKGMNERFLSANALNANWVFTQLLHAVAPGAWPGRGTIQTTDPWLTVPPKLLFAAGYGFALSRLTRGVPTFTRAVGWTLAAYLAYFAFNTGVHENHLFPAILLAAVLAWEAGTWGRVVFAAVALAANLNLVLFYGLRGEPLTPPALGPLDFAALCSALIVALIAAFFAWLARAERRTA